MSKLKVKELCKERGTTISELAVKIGIAQESLSRAINGNPQLETLEKIASALDVSIYELFEKPEQNTFSCPHCGKQIEVTKPK